MQKDHYTYPAIFSYDTDGISVEFPDLPGCFTCSSTTETAISMAKEALALHLSGMEDDGECIPLPTDIPYIVHEPSQAIMLIEVWMPLYRDRIKYASVKKTLTIPKWLNDIAEENNINFSQALQNTLKEQLGIYNPKG